MRQLIFVIAILLPAALTANPVPDFPFVIVSEPLEKKVQPDFAIVYIDVIAYDEHSEAAMASLVKSSTGLIDTLKQYDIPLSQIESFQVSKTTRRARKEGVYYLEILGYEVSQRFKLTIKDLSKYSSLIDKLVRLDGIEDVDALFRTNKEETYKTEMIQELSDKVRNKATALATAQSRKIKRVYGVTTESNFGMAYGVFSLEYSPATYAALKIGDVSAGAGIIMAVPDYIEVRQQITAIYELE